MTVRAPSERNIADERGAARVPGATGAGGPLPSWLAEPEGYEPARDRDAFIGKSMLSVAGVLTRLRVDDGREAPFSPSPAFKLVLGLACILMTSLAQNFVFVLLMLALVLVRACILPSSALRRVAGVSAGAAGVSLLVMLPAILLGQGQAPLLVGTKVLTTTAIALEVALTTPAHEMMRALSAFRVSEVVTLTLGLTLKYIVVLGTVALEMLEALRLRSVGRNADKRASVGGVGGMLFLKSREAAEDVAAAMRCRGFDGRMAAPARGGLRAQDAAWALGLALLACAFGYLQSLV